VHQHSASSRPQRNGAPHTAQRSALFFSKLADGFAQEGELARDARAAIAHREVQAQQDALAEAEPPVEALGGEARRLFAVQQSHFENQFISRHLRSAMRAR